MSAWEGSRIVIIGAARQGLALARYLAEHGAKVVLTDQRSVDELAQARAIAGRFGDRRCD